MKNLTLRDLQNLPPTVDLMTAARILGIGRTKAYELAKKNEFPARTIRIGDLYRVSTAALLHLLGNEATTAVLHAEAMKQQGGSLLR